MLDGLSYDEKVLMVQVMIAVLMFVITAYKVKKFFRSRKKQRRFFNWHEKNQLWEMYKGKCALCKRKCLPYGHEENSAEYDHIKSFKNGGLTEIENGQLLCKKCNRKKGAK